MAPLPVFFEQRLVGHIDVKETGPEFAYFPDWLSLRGAFPISTAMPLRAKPYGADTFVPWASNLLPESDQLRAVGQYLGIALGDVVGLLSAIGRDTAGALSIGQSGSTSSGHWRPIENDEALERIINVLPNKPFLVGDEGVSMSLAGVQSKLAVAVTNTGRICIPTDGSPSTHILKPDGERLWGGVQNEAFCLTLARRIGIATSDVTTGKVGARTYLLVKRFDRQQVGERWRRLHQEDFCQALLKPPSAKYESNQTGVKGPTLADMFSVTRKFMSPPDVPKLVDYVIYNVIACNTDAHAKNYSMLIRAGSVTLAPLYDVMCADVWENITKNLSQKIAGKNRGDHLRGLHWQRFAVECGLNPRQVISRVSTLANSVLASTDAAAAAVASMPAGNHPQLEHTKRAIERRAKNLLTQLHDMNADANEAPSA